MPYFLSPQIEYKIIIMNVIFLIIICKNGDKQVYTPEYIHVANDLV